MLCLKVLIFLTVALVATIVNCEVHGKPETFIYFTHRSIIVNQNAIKALENLADYKVAVYSVMGAYRMGKSFLMNYCLRYLYANVSSLNMAMKL
jgi:hypothetical protein